MPELKGLLDDVEVNLGFVKSVHGFSLLRRLAKTITRTLCKRKHSRESRKGLIHSSVLNYPKTQTGVSPWNKLTSKNCSEARNEHGESHSKGYQRMTDAADETAKDDETNKNGNRIELTIFCLFVIFITNINLQ